MDKLMREVCAQRPVNQSTRQVDPLAADCKKRSATTIERSASIRPRSPRFLEKRLRKPLRPTRPSVREEQYGREISVPLQSAKTVPAANRRGFTDSYQYNDRPAPLEDIRSLPAS